MKIKRFVASDMRSAIRQVQEEQGADAVILSNRRVGNQIEVVAATDYDESLVHQALRQAPAAAPDAHDTPPPAARAAFTPDDPDDAAPAETAATTGKSPRAAEKIVWAQDPHLHKLEKELGDLRSMLEGRLGSVENLAWEARAPQRHEAVQALQRIGVDQTIARRVVEKIPETPLPVPPAALALRMLGRRLAFLSDAELGAHPVIALVGPTGVGKTTTIAKLAARHAMNHGADGLTLVSTDNFRIGAAEQLRAFGRLLGVPVVTAATPQQLRETVAEGRRRGTVLIDTAGVGPRDQALLEQFDSLQALPEAAVLLCLGADHDHADLKAITARFARTQPLGCVLTKVDETSRLGAALSLALESQLPLAYFTDGQNVPADLHRATREALVERADAQLRPATAARTAEETLRDCA